MARILVIGGTGFLGSHLIKELSKTNKIRCLVRKQTKKRTIDFLKKHKVELWEGDLNDKKSLKGIDKGITKCYYLAGGGNTAALTDKDYQVLKDYNLKTLENFLQTINHIKKIVFFSSISAIGKILPHEKVQYQAEQLIKKYSKKYKYSILRPSIVYGENGFGDSCDFIRRIDNGYFMFPGDGENVTPWVYVGNVINATILLMEEGKNKEYTINHKEHLSYNKIFQTISKNLNKRIKTINLPVSFLKPFIFLYETLSLLFNNGNILFQHQQSSQHIILYILFPDMDT